MVKEEKVEVILKDETGIIHRYVLTLNPENDPYTAFTNLVDELEITFTRLTKDNDYDEEEDEEIPATLKRVEKYDE